MKFLQRVKWIILPLLLIVAPMGYAGSDSESEIAQKVKIIKQLLNIVTWPMPPERYQVCLLGEFENIQKIESLNGTIIQKHPITVKKITDIKSAKSCQIIYLSKSAASQTKSIIDALCELPILMISDMDDFAQNGGSVNFMKLNNVLAITINLESIKKSNLKIDMNAYDQITIFPEEKDLQQ